MVSLDWTPYVSSRKKMHLAPGRRFRGTRFFDHQVFPGRAGDGNGGPGAGLLGRGAGVGDIGR